MKTETLHAIFESSRDTNWPAKSAALRLAGASNCAALAAVAQSRSIDTIAGTVVHRPRLALSIICQSRYHFTSLASGFAGETHIPHGAAR